MGMASSTGLGLAMARPDRRVVVVDGDGAAVMNLGGMVTVGARQPQNLLWMILENGAFLETGGQPIATHGPADLVGIARAAASSRPTAPPTPPTLAALLDEGLARPARRWSWPASSATPSATCRPSIRSGSSSVSWTRSDVTMRRLYSRGPKRAASAGRARYPQTACRAEMPSATSGYVRYQSASA